MPMSFSLTQMILISAAYLAVLFGVAWISERGMIPRAIIRHPLTYTLSLGVYASAWAFYGTVGLAYQYGYGFLSSYPAFPWHSCWRRCCFTRFSRSPAPTSFRRWPTCSPSAFAVPG